MASQPDPTSLPHESELLAREQSRARWLRAVLGVLYLSALSLLIVWEYRERLESLSPECALKERSTSSLYNLPYSKFLDWASSDAAGHVVAVGIPAELEEVQSNLCLGRAYMADVLRALAVQHPATVVLDKFYSAGACASDPAPTHTLLEAVRGLQAPVVVGESTRGLEKRVESSCLVRKEQLDFLNANVRHGLTRLNSEPERFPLRWLVLSSLPRNEESLHSAEADKEAAVKPQAEFADSLSLAAVRAYDPAFAAQRSVQRLIAQDDHAYANLGVEIPRLTTTELLCAASDEDVRRRWRVACAEKAALPAMMGKIVVIGAEDLTDEKVVLQRRMWGFELQARYIETLLSGDYLRYLPLQVGFAWVRAVYLSDRRAADAAGSRCSAMHIRAAGMRG